MSTASDSPVPDEPARGEAPRSVPAAQDADSTAISNAPGEGWVLVVEDDEPVRRTIRRMLEGSGYPVIDAVSIDEAVDRYASYDVRVLVYDLIQPDCEPTSAFSLARSAFLGARILAISGGGRAGSMPLLEAASRLGASATLSKPFPQVALLAVVEVLWTNSA